MILTLLGFLCHLKVLLVRNIVMLPSQVYCGRFWQQCQQRLLNPAFGGTICSFSLIEAIFNVDMLTSRERHESWVTQVILLGVASHESFYLESPVTSHQRVVSLQIISYESRVFWSRIKNHESPTSRQMASHESRVTSLLAKTGWHIDSLSPNKPSFIN